MVSSTFEISQVKGSHSWFFDQHVKYFKSLNASQDDTESEPELVASEFVNNNFDSKDFSLVNSDY